MIHVLKEYPEFFEDVISGRKTFEVRKADRDFKVGDLLALNEYNPNAEKYTNRCCIVHIDYILDNLDYCKEGYVILGIKPCKPDIFERTYDVVNDVKWLTNYERIKNMSVDEMAKHLTSFIYTYVDKVIKSFGFTEVVYPLKDVLKVKDDFRHYLEMTDCNEEPLYDEAKAIK